MKKIKSIVHGEWRWKREGLQRVSEESFGDDGNILYLDCGDGFPCVKMLKLNKLYLNVCTSLCFDYTSVKM